MFENNKLIVKYRGSYYDVITGEKLGTIAIQNGTIVDLDSSNQNYTVKDRKESGMPFIYKTRDKENPKFYMSYNLTLHYLRDVAYDYLGIPKSVGLVVESPTFLIVFLGNKSDIFFSKDPEERRTFLESFFQGIEYKNISLEELVKVVTPQLPFALILVVLLILIGFLGYFAYSMLFSVDEEELQKFTAPPPPPPPPSEFIDIGFTQAVLDGLIRFPLKPVEVIKNINFSSGYITLFSIIPEEGFKKDENGYKKTGVLYLEY